MSRVVLHVYDLSGGLARQFSPALLGRTIDGIWHTGIVLYGREYYFGGGILCDPPERTPYGIPVERHDLGETHIPRDTFEEFLDGIRPRFRMEKYHLLENNCNHFTNECSLFLVGKSIPSHIAGLPEEVINTPFGMMIKPLIDQFFSQNGWGTAMGPVSPSPAIPQLFSPSPPPSSATTPSVSQASTPAKLHPRHLAGHKHASLNLKTVRHPQPLLFTQANLQDIFGKLNQFLKEEKGKTHPDGLSQNDEALLAALAKALAVPTSKLPDGTYQLLELLLERDLLPIDKIFPVLDIVRFMLLRSDSNSNYTTVNNQFLMKLIQKYYKDSPRPAQLLTYRLASNVFAHPSGINYMLHVPEYLTQIVEIAVFGIHATDKIIQKAVATLCCNVSLFLDRRHAEEILQVFSALIHVVSQSKWEDPETDFRHLLALGMLLYCNDECVELAHALELDVTKALSSSNNDTKTLAKEINTMLT